MSTPEERYKMSHTHLAFDGPGIRGETCDQAEIRILAGKLAEMIEALCPNGEFGREERETAILKLRECVMWANASIDMRL